MLQTPRQGWKRLLHPGVIVTLLVCIALAIFMAIRPPQNTPATGGNKSGRSAAMGNARAQPVSTVAIARMDMPVWVAALGTATPKQMVTVKSRIDGELIRVHFTEGSLLKQGDLLAEIDARALHVQLMQAQGQLAKNSALLKNAELDLQRYRQLLKQDSIAKQQVDTQESLVRQYQGALAVDKAAVENAKLQLSYARITAPITGRVGLRQVDPGNMVRATDGNGLVVMTQIQPMTVLFSVPEPQLPHINARLLKNETVVVEAWDREQKVRLDLGRLLTLDNVIDTASGAIKARAEFANNNHQLFPNQFVNVRLLADTLPNSLVVPAAAVLRSARGTLIYVVNDDNTVRAVTVTQGATEGNQVSIRAQDNVVLEAGMRIVADGLDKLRDGATVEVITPNAEGATTKGRPMSEEKNSSSSGKGSRRNENRAPAM